MKLAYLLLFVAALFAVFSGQGAKEKKNETLASFLPLIPVKEVESEKNQPAHAKSYPGETNIILQSKDAGQTWEDISFSLPINELPEDVVVSGEELFLRYKDGIYRIRTNLETPVWEKDNANVAQCNRVAFNSSGTKVYGYDGKIPAIKTWSPMNLTFSQPSARTIFETSNGTILTGYDDGLFKSSDRGQTWKQVFNEGWVMDLVESEGVLLATGQKGIMRSIDNGEHWEWVISQGGVGIAIERIDGGFAAICYSSSTNSRRIYISFDRGENWREIDKGLRPSLTISSIKQIGPYLICGHPDGIFRSFDMGRTWNIVHQGIWNPFKKRDDGRVFKIYESGNILYAVARNAGC